MERILFVFGNQQQLVAALAIAALLLLLCCCLFWARAARERRSQALAIAQRQQDLNEKMAELARSNAELTGRMRSMGEILGSRQSDLARLVSERLDAVGARVGQGLEASSRTANENLSKLNE